MAAEQQTADKKLNQRFVTESAQAGDIAALIEPVIEDLGYRLVRVIVSGRDGMTVQIMADRQEGDFGIKDCEVISNELSPFLDSHDPIPGEYHLEVSSPGIDRPLVRPSDFLAWAGFEAKLETCQPIDGRKRFKGRLAGYENDEVLLEINDETQGAVTIGLNKSLIASAKLVLNDELLKAAGKPAK